MKKVFQLISSMNIGGAETMVKDYALLLDKNEIELKIIAMDKCYNSANEQVLKAHGIEIIYLTELLYPADKKLNPFQKVMRFVSRYYYFRKIMLTEKPDVLHCHLHMGLYLKVLPLKKLKTKGLLRDKYGLGTLYTIGIRRRKMSG